MQADRWKLIEETFHAGLELPPPQRSVYLDAACGDDVELRREVESLIEAQPHGEEFMARPTGGVSLASLELEQSSLEGRVLNHYRIGALIGSGGTADVYRARDTRLERDAAIKVLHDVRFLDREQLAPMYREARLLASLNHPNIASVYGVEEADELCGIALELVEGEALSERILGGSLSVPQALEIGKQILAGLQAAHAKGIIHRDLKPSNIRLTADGNVKLVDFGLAKLLGSLDTGGASSGFSTRGLVAGTLAYMSPEQARGRPVDERTDIWAFGCVLYEMLFGRPAFQGDSPTDTLVRIATEEPAWAAFVGLPDPGPDAMERLLRKCIQKAANLRYQSVREIATDFEAICRGATGLPEPPGAPQAPSGDDDFVLPNRFALPLFMFAQLGYMAIYVSAMFYIDDISEILAEDFQLSETAGLVATTVLALCGIAVRLYLISSMGWRHPAAGRKFMLLFPVVLVLDGIWAASPLLLQRQIGYGLALVGAAMLAYVPFSQRTLVRTLYPVRSRRMSSISSRP